MNGNFARGKISGVRAVLFSGDWGRGYTGDFAVDFDFEMLRIVHVHVIYMVVDDVKELV